MSREIKFRVLIDNKIYYQDKYEAYGDNLSSIDICKETITITSFYNYEDVYRFEYEEVKLMQYTGVKDKNGKEKDPEIIDIDNFITIKGIKAMGNQFIKDKIKSIDFEIPEHEIKEEDIEIPPAVMEIPEEGIQGELF